MSKHASHKTKAKVQAKAKVFFADLGPSWALRVFRELLDHRVPQQVESIDDGGSEPQHLHTQQVDTVPDVPPTQVQRVGDTHVHVEDEGTHIEGHGDPSIPVDLCLQHHIQLLLSTENNAHVQGCTEMEACILWKMQPVQCNCA